MSDALKGVKVIELATFVAAPSCGLFLANQGAEVIRIESKGGDQIRWTAASEWRSESPYENTTFDMINANKKCIALDLKSAEGREILFKLLEKADVFITNWREKALEKQGLSYDSIHERFPKLVYAGVSGYGQKGPDKDLPGYDFTAFWARGGIVGSLKDRDFRPFILTSGFGDSIAGMALCEGVLAAYIKALRTGVGERVHVSLLHTAVYCQATMLVAEQFRDIGRSYPLSYKEINNPFNGTYMTSDGRYIQTCVPPFNMLFPKYMNAIGRPDLIGVPRYTIESIQQNDLYDEFISILEDAFSKKTAEEWKAIMTEADIPFSICQTWSEVLEDPQVNATDVFYDMHYPTGLDLKLVRHPTMIGDELPDYKIAPYLGKDSEEVLHDLGYSPAEIRRMHDDGIFCTWDDVKAAHNG